MGDTPRHAARAALALLALLAALTPACDNQDIAGPERLSVGPGQPSQARAFEHPYLGRLAIDFGLTNGAQQGVFDIRVQAQTSGALDELACEAGVSSAPRTLNAVPLGESPPAIRERNRTHFIRVPANLAGPALVNVRIPSTSTWRLFSSETDVPLTLSSLDGVELIPERIVSISECSLFGTLAEYALTDGTYQLSLTTDGAVVLVQEACESTRTVSATCPGGARTLFQAAPIGLDPEGFISGRIHSHELGIGDRTVVELKCNALTPNCEGELEIFFIAEPLECRTDLDCSNAEVCQSEGYCQRARKGCSASGAPQLPGILLWLAAALACVRARGRREP